MNNKPVAYVNSMCNDYIDWKIEPISIDGQPLYTHPSDRISELEQQLKEEIQARADALDDLNNRIMKFMKSYNEMASKLEEVGGAYTHPADLTDEEIQEIAHGFGEIAWLGDTTYDFARAILRKASEK